MGRRPGGQKELAVPGPAPSLPGSRRSLPPRTIIVFPWADPADPTGPKLTMDTSQQLAVSAQAPQSLPRCTRFGSYPPNHRGAQANPYADSADSRSGQGKGRSALSCRRMSLVGVGLTEGQRQDTRGSGLGGASDDCRAESLGGGRGKQRATGRCWGQDGGGTGQSGRTGVSAALPSQWSGGFSAAASQSGPVRHPPPQPVSWPAKGRASFALGPPSSLSLPPLTMG